MAIDLFIIWFAVAGVVAFTITNEEHNIKENVQIQSETDTGY